MTRKHTDWLLVLSGMIIIVLGGCGGIHHSVDFERGYIPQAGTKIEVSAVKNETGQAFNIIATNFEYALVKELENNALLYSTNDKSKLSASCRITEYTQGDAFKRWLMPGWGSAVLAVACSLTDYDKTVGTIHAKHTFSSGGPFTDHAGQTVIVRLAEDIVGDLMEKLKPLP